MHPGEPEENRDRQRILFPCHLVQRQRSIEVKVFPQVYSVHRHDVGIAGFELPGFLKILIRAFQVIDPQKLSAARVGCCIVRVQRQRRFNGLPPVRLDFRQGRSTGSEQVEIRHGQQHIGLAKRRIELDGLP